MEEGTDGELGEDGEVEESQAERARSQEGVDEEEVVELVVGLELKRNQPAEGLRALASLRLLGRSGRVELTFDGMVEFGTD